MVYIGDMGPHRQLLSSAKLTTVAAWNARWVTVSSSPVALG